MKRSIGALTLPAVVLCLSVPTASAHYLWVAVAPKPGQHGIANVYFEEGPAARDGQYLDPFVDRGVTWMRTIGAEEPVKLAMSDTKKNDKRWLSGPLTASGPLSVDSYGKWGVYKYGDTDVLLHYYARCLDVNTVEQLQALARAKQMELDIVPHSANGVVELNVVWQGKPADGRSVQIRGPKGLKENLKTNDTGKATFKPAVKGLYTFRTYVEQQTGGEFEGKKYQLIRRHATLTMHLPLAK